MALVVKAPGNTPCKIEKWKVKKGYMVTPATVLGLYKYQDSAKTQKLKCNHFGTVTDVLIPAGQEISPGDEVLHLEGCKHPTVMKDMCADCGADLRESHGLAGDRKSSTAASVAMVHSIPELIVSEELALELGRQDEQRLLHHRKLVLLVDLDQTLLHTTNDNIPANLKDVDHFQLWHGRWTWYHTKFRPQTKTFLDTISKDFELHICTFGVRMYAHTIAKFIDPDGKYFSHRILSRDECFSANSKTANLKALFPCGDSMVCIIDDREDVWKFAPNLIHVKPYLFFEGTADINAPPGVSNVPEEGVKAPRHNVKVIKVPRIKSAENETAPKMDQNIGEDVMNNEQPTNMLSGEGKENIDYHVKGEDSAQVEKLGDETKCETKNTDDFINQEKHSNLEVQTVHAGDNVGDQTECKIEESDFSAHDKDHSENENHVQKEIVQKEEISSQADSSSETAKPSCETNVDSAVSTEDIKAKDIITQKHEEHKLNDGILVNYKRDDNVENAMGTDCANDLDVDLDISDSSDSDLDVKVEKVIGSFPVKKTTSASDEMEGSIGDTLEVKDEKIGNHSQANENEQNKKEDITYGVDLTQVSSTKKMKSSVEVDSNRESIQGKSIEISCDVNRTAKIGEMTEMDPNQETDLNKKVDSTRVASSADLSKECNSSVDLNDVNNPPVSESREMEPPTKVDPIKEVHSIEEVYSYTDSAKVVDPPEVNPIKEVDTTEEKDPVDLDSKSQTGAPTDVSKMPPEEFDEIVEWEDTDDYLIYLEDILKRIHTAFYEMYDQSQEKNSNEIPDLKKIIPYVKKKVLKGTNILFSGVIPTNQPTEKSRAYVIAKSLGANVHSSFVRKDGSSEHTTHLVAAKLGTVKVNQVKKHKHIKVVNPDWLWTCAERWEWVDERLYALTTESSYPYADSPDPVKMRPKSSRSSKTPNTKRKEDCSKGKGDAADCMFSNTINPMYSFSSTDIKDMDKEVDEIFDESESDDSDDELRRVVLGFGKKRDRESSSDADSLSAEHPKGWGKKRKKRTKIGCTVTEEAENNFTEEEMDDESEIKQKIVEDPLSLMNFSDKSSESGSEFNESIGSVDDEMAAALEKEFLSR